MDYLPLKNKLLESDIVALADEVNCMAKLLSILDGLVSNTDLAFTESDKDSILAMGDRETSWAKENGYNPLRIGYFDKARAL